MLHTITKIKDIDERKFLDIYAEGNAENVEELYPEYEPAEALAKAEASFREFLPEFFSEEGNTYYILEEDGVWVSALRLSATGEREYYLEALETRPDLRRRGCAKRLFEAVFAELKKGGGFVIRDCVSKRNLPSLRTHEACGFAVVSDVGTNYIDGSVNERCFGLEYDCR